MKQKNSRLESGINISGIKNILRKSKKAENVSSCAASVPNFSPSWTSLTCEGKKKYLVLPLKIKLCHSRQIWAAVLTHCGWGKAPCDSSSTHTYSMPTEYKRAIAEKTFDLGGQSSRRIGMRRWRRPSGLLRDAITMLPVLKPHLPLQHKRPSWGQVKRFNFKQLLFCTGTLAPKHLFALPLPDRDLCGPFLWVQDKCLGPVPG